MSEPQGAPPRPKTAMLSRHWKLAVLAAAGFATVIGTTTTVEANEGRTSEATPATRATSPKGAEGKGTEGKGDEGREKGDKGKGGKGDHGKADKAGRTDKGDRDEYGHHGDDDTTYVECDPNDLIANLVDLNSDAGGTLVLAKDCTYTLTVNEDGNGLPTITQPITIRGNGATIQRAANADAFRLFDVGSGGDLKLSHLTLTRGTTVEDEAGAAIRVSPAGRVDLDCVTVTRNAVGDLENADAGGVFNEGILTIRNSTLSKNAGEDGAAVYNDGGKVEITDSRITGNTSDDSDGYAAVYSEGGGTLKVSRSLVAYNYAYYGGGIYSSFDGNGATTTVIDRSAVVYNHAAFGGGIYGDDGTLVVRDSTVAYNTTSGEGEGTGGGGFYLERNVSTVITDSKVHANTAANGNGGGILTELNEGSVLAIRDSKVSGNQAPGNGAMGGGIFVGEGDEVRLTDTKVTGNISDEPAGGIHNLGAITAYGKTKIVDNVPTNCQAIGTNPVPNCFG
ncbi:hypothetical protein [Streptomyces sp. NPDC059828]|uniref:hypothetical protein n=1 Tax=Streptomyces sp. NPDC059828 TaxID=3346965 RepID=UPI003668D9D6